MNLAAMTRKSAIDTHHFRSLDPERGAFLPTEVATWYSINCLSCSMKLLMVVNSTLNT